MSTNAFTQLGNTVVFTAATSAPTPVQAVPTSSTLAAIQYRIINSGSVVVFLGTGTSSALATSNAVVATSSQSSIPLLPGTDEILTLQPNAYFTGITSSGTAAIYITPGDGM